MKKPSIISFVTTLLLVAVVCTQAQEIVTDSAGNSLFVGQRYFIQPVNTGGGLVPAAVSIPFCPLGITQTPLPDQPGLPATFIPRTTAQDNFVRTTLRYMIEFKSDIWPVCNEFSKLWVANAVELSDVSMEPPILIGGRNAAINASFFFQKAEGVNTYKLSNTVFGDIGTKPGGLFGAPQLILTNDNAKRLLVKFKKVDDVTAATSTSLVEKFGLRMFPFY